MLPLFAQDGTPQQPPGGCGASILFAVALLAIWWFLVIRPQSKAEKARRAKIEALQKGDRVRTRAGIEGVVVRVQDDKVILKIDLEGKVHVPFAKSAVEDVLGGDAAATPETK